MKTAIITGITGQDGAYLSSFLLNKNYRVIGIVRNASKSNVKNLKYLGVSDRITLIEANLLDLSNIIRILDKNKPDEFYNLAAQSSVSLSFEQPIG
ncbi:MAG: GDP-mannose 4,6-dehydratase, partial [Planctomycetota bacterium]